LTFVRFLRSIRTYVSEFTKKGRSMLTYPQGRFTRPLNITAIVALILFCACSPQAIRPSSEHSGIDPRLTGTWLLVKESRVAPPERVPPEIRAVQIHDDGRWEGVGVHAASGTLRVGCPLHYRQRGRRVLWTDSAALQFTQLDRGSLALVSGEGKWKMDGETLHLQLYTERSGWWSETYTRAALGDTVTTPLRIRTALQLNGTPLPLNDAPSVPPGSVNLMALDDATHLSVYFDCSVNDSLNAGISIRLHGIDGPGTYPIDTESQTGGMVSIRDRETGLNNTANRASAGTVTIDMLDLENLRCQGRLDVRFDQEHRQFPSRSKLHLTGSFELPVWTSDRYDISSTRSPTGGVLRGVTP